LGVEEEESLDEVIARLRGELGAEVEPESYDAAGTAGNLAGALLDLAGRDGVAEPIHEAIALCEAAIRRFPGHEDRQWWWYWLADAHARLAMHDDDVVEYERAIAWLSVLRGEQSHDDADRVETEWQLAQLYWARFETVAATVVHDGAARAEVDRLVAALAEPAARHPFVRMFYGMALMRQAPAQGDPQWLHRGIATLAEALDGVPLGTVCRTRAVADLVHGYRDQAALGRPEALDLAVAAGEEAIAGAGDDDLLAVLLLHRGLAWVYQERFDGDRQRTADRDRAIELWRFVNDHVDAEAFALVGCGHLLFDRADRGRSPHDLDDALHVAHAAVRATGPGHPLGVEARYLLGSVYALRDEHAEALHWLDAADLAGPDDDERVRIMRERLRSMSILTGQGTVPRQRLAAAAAQARAVLRDAAHADDVWRARLAGTLAAVLHGEVATGDRERLLADIRALVSSYAHVVMPDPRWRVELDSAAALLTFLTGSSAEQHQALRELERLAGSLPGLDTTALMAPLLAQRAVNSGDLGAQRAAVTMLRGGEGDAAAAALAAMIDAQHHSSAGDAEASRAAVAEARRLTAAVPDLAFMGAMFDGLDGFDGQLVADRQPPRGALEAAAQIVQLVVAQRRALARRDGPELRRIAAAATAMIARFPDNTADQRITALEAAGEAETALAEVVPAERAGAARRAAAHLREACELAGGPHHPRWPDLTRCLAVAVRYNDRPGSRRHGLSSLRTSTWQVLIQADDELALQAARSAAAASRLVASWCVQDQAYDDLVTALDAGRGLTLYAAAASRSIPDRLAEAGHHDLAARWRDSGGRGSATPASIVPDDLRERALHALSADAFAPVRPEQIRRALAAVGADALVYLAATDEWQPGYAVIVPVSGGAEVLALPGLEPGHAPGGPTGDVRELVVPGPEDQDQDQGRRLDEVCRWAWTAAMGPLLQYTRRWHLQRPARLVLVPTGDLSLVPWHAAVHEGRYALQDAVISYGVSARMFCASAQHPLRRPSSALIVGDPRGDLPYAAAEASAVHAAFHPGGTLLERATPDDVLDWIAAPQRGPSLLHLACHGRVDPARPVEAHLALTGGHLPTRRLLEAARRTGVDIDRVVLSACSTGVTGTAHDEAVSLAAAFLAGGAHTVFGTLWTVPDVDTSVLMYLLHHHLSVDGCEPVEALRRAQLWMIDADRTPPPGMPPALANVPGIDDPRGWAAFVHLGR
jgi:tetratricopeptide (TPR) repeat protein